MDTKIEVKIIPHGRPTITYGVDDHPVSTIELVEPMSLQFNLDLGQGSHEVYIDFASKTNDTPDMAVEIDCVTAGGIAVDRLKWAGKYYPQYPEPWASQQTETLQDCINSATYLGWNGRWVLQFTVPIFTWIHRIENLGWIYSIDPKTKQLIKNG